MKKKYFAILFIAVLTPFFFNSCDIVEDPPNADFSASELYSSGEITISFSDNSSNSPDEWYWTFEGGYPAISTERNPTVTYSESGTFDVTLEVTNDGGDDIITAYDYINVVQFNNPLFTDMDVTVGNETKTMSPDYYVQFVQINNTSVSYYAETSGKTTSGTVIGEELFWDNTVDLTSYSSYNLILNSDFIFLYITNPYSAYYYDLNPFWVNFSDYYDETMDNIVIPCDGVKYRTGYYYTNYEMEVRAYYQYYTSSYESWFIYPSTENNQFTNLIITNRSIKKQAKETKENSLKEPEMLYPVAEIKNRAKLDPSAKNLAPSNRK